jgi:LuxR family maltose regulon positive regulatory protein
LSKAREWASAQGLAVDDALSYLREFEHITLARLLLAEYQTHLSDRSVLDAIGLLDRLLQAAEAGDRTGSAIEILIVLALAHAARGDSALALAPLERALALAEPEGYVRIFAGEGKPLARLLSALAARGSLPTYTARLLAACEPAASPRAIKADLPAAPPAQSLIEPLSRRELEVLQLMAQGLSNREIGERLFLALNTVKGHNQKIFAKLQVERRTEAIARARDLHLL